jgi:hypothetical protein
MIAVPADPEKPEINSAIEYFVSRAGKRIGGEGWLTSAAVAGRNVLGLMAIF